MLKSRIIIVYMLKLTYASDRAASQICIGFFLQASLLKHAKEIKIGDILRKNWKLLNRHVTCKRKKYELAYRHL